MAGSTFSLGTLPERKRAARLLAGSRMDLLDWVVRVITCGDFQFRSGESAMVAICGKCDHQRRVDVSRAVSTVHPKRSVNGLAHQLDADHHAEHDLVCHVQPVVVVML